MRVNMFAKSHDDLAKIENFLSRQSSKFRNCGQICPQYSLRDSNFYEKKTKKKD